MLFRKTEKSKKTRPKETLSEAILGIAGVLVSGLFIITFIVQAFEIPSRSMENTLLVGDHLFVDRLTAVSKTNYVGPLMPYRPIRRGEIAVFISPETPDLHLVKRIIGVPGDRIHLVHGDLYVNGVKQMEPYVIRIFRNYDPYRDEFPSESPLGRDLKPGWPMTMQANLDHGDLVVPPHHYFAMGDSRENSRDSRYWGFVPEENIMGRPLFVYWSFNTTEEEYNHTSWSDRIQSVFHVIVHFFDKTRWSRMFHLVR
ncbi:MAG TPA: signal peptidase I [Candidatus Angelobacter sp.]